MNVWHLFDLFANCISAEWCVGGWSALWHIDLQTKHSVMAIYNVSTLCEPLDELLFKQTPDISKWLGSNKRRLIQDNETDNWRLRKFVIYSVQIKSNWIQVEKKLWISFSTHSHSLINAWDDVANNFFKDVWRPWLFLSLVFEHSFSCILCNFYFYFFVMIGLFFVNFCGVRSKCICGVIVRWFF